MENKLKESIEVLCKALREDEDYYYNYNEVRTLTIF